MTQALNLANFANYLNTSGQVSASGIQSGVIPASPIPSGTVMLFYQSAAPSGWTQVTSLNDYALRIVSGTGGTTGGTTAFSTVFANQTPTITTSGLSAGATTLSSTQIPSHSHSNTLNTYYANPGCSGGSIWTGANVGFGNQTWSTANTGGGGSHTHSIFGSATSSAITLNVQYANIILCSKN
jgi:hypothetical protein